MWLFGYGSLIWKVDFKYCHKQVGYIKGFKRRFWWWSEDHRGVPGNPGRVVNLLPSEDTESKVWGMAFQIDDDLWTNEVEPHLDHREKGGYSQTRTLFHPKDDETSTVEVVMYVGLKTHRQYAGPAAIEEIAHTISTSVGPSGPNIDYLYNLADAIRTMGQFDSHVFQLEKEVKLLEDQKQQ